jgi:hypothetical protein
MSGNRPVSHDEPPGLRLGASPTEIMPRRKTLRMRIMKQAITETKSYHTSESLSLLVK